MTTLRNTETTQELEAILRNQDGVVARSQVLDCGLGSAHVRRRLRARDWVAVHPGVYVEHTGPLTDRQRRWAAVLHAMPAALSHETAIRAAAVGGAVTSGAASRRAAATAQAGTVHGPIHVVVDASRRVSPRPGIVVHYSRHMAERVLDHTHPPRVRLEHAVLDVAGGASSDLAAIACLSGVVQERLTTPDRLLAALASRRRTGRRDFIGAVLADVRDGTCSVLEHRYLVDVERPHGLPTSVRQTPTGVGRRGFRDVEYPEWGLIVELDGRAHHDDAAARDADLERDLDAMVFAGKPSIRLGWGQAVDRPCRTAGKVATILGALGWRGTAVRCSPQCPLE
ncbi:hypothetical protein [Gordonia shandongensis]|uniref:hypothetical protein n=1 Tax=Gordonia shandongensis TaxID=376351 RepID=UPI0006867078|nr:hypothetical protein [Gordonia shandongensis]